jgi:hypothetical protein
VPQGMSKLDILLKRCEIPFEKFITKCNAVKETLTAKKSQKKKCILILCQDFFITRGTLNQKIHKYNYFEVESLTLIEYQDPKKFGFRLNFYSLEEGAVKKVMVFECDEVDAFNVKDNELEKQNTISAVPSKSATAMIDTTAL